MSQDIDDDYEAKHAATVVDVPLVDVDLIFNWEMIITRILIVLLVMFSVWVILLAVKKGQAITGIGSTPASS
jgi:hypothetical protein